MTRTYNKRLFPDETSDEPPRKKPATERIKTLADKKDEFKRRCERFGLPVNPVPLVFPPACTHPMCLNSSALKITSYWVCSDCSAVAPNYVCGHYTRFPESKWNSYPKNKKQPSKSLVKEHQATETKVAKAEKKAQQTAAHQKAVPKVVLKDMAERPTSVANFFRKSKAVQQEDAAPSSEYTPPLITVTANDTSGECAPERIRADIININRTSFTVDLIIHRQKTAAGEHPV